VTRISDVLLGGHRTTLVVEVKKIFNVNIYHSYQSYIDFMKAGILIVMALLLAIVATEAQISLEPNVDRPGMNYRMDYLGNVSYKGNICYPDCPELCADICANDPNCKAFTYVKKGTRSTYSSPECWLKNPVPNAVSAEAAFLALNFLLLQVNFF